MSAAGEAGFAGPELGRWAGGAGAPVRYPDPAVRVLDPLSVSTTGL